MFVASQGREVVGGAVQDKQVAPVDGASLLFLFWTMTKPTIPQISKQNADHDAKAEYDGRQSAADVNIEEGEEDPRIGLLVDVRFPTGVHREHLGGFFFFLWL
jgi:hypothetical protein